jgi:outer membrane protein assembly factor BamB
MADDFNRFPPGEEERLLDELHSLGVLDDAPPPNARFVRALRGDLMERAATIASRPIATHGGLQLAGSLNATLPASLPRQRPIDRRLTLQLGLVAALLLAMIGSFLAMSGSEKGSKNILNGLATQSDASDQPFALIGQNVARTGITDQSGPMFLPETTWRTNLTNPNLVPVLAVDGVIYAVDDEGGEIQAISAATGRPFWGATVGRMVGPAIAVANGFVYVSTEGPGRWGSDPGFLIALDRATGEERWRYESGGSVSTSPLVNGGIVYVSSKAGTLRAVDGSTGKEAWQIDLAERSPATPFPELAQGFLSNFSPTLANGIIYVSNNDGKIYAVDIASHEIVWQVQTTGNVLSTPAIVDGKLYLTAMWVQDGSEDLPTTRLYQLDATTGKSDWETEFANDIDLIAADTVRLYIRSQHEFQILDRASGAMIWSTATSAGFDTVITAQALYLSDSAGNVTAYALGTGEAEPALLWSVYLGDYVYGKVALDGTLFVRTNAGLVLALTEAPVATPAAGSTADLSGLPDCEAPAPIDWQNISGEPTQTLVPLETKMVRGTPRADPQEYGQPPSLAFDDVPTGAQADDSVRQGILLSLHDIATCNRVGQTTDVSGFFSDDFFRRHWVKAQIDINHANPAGFLRYVPEQAINYTSIIPLADGRVSVYVKINEMNGSIIVFVQHDGRWVIDEIVAVAKVAGAVG